VDRRAIRRRVDLKGMDIGEKLRTISLLLADRRQGLDGGKLHAHALRLVLAGVRNGVAPRVWPRAGRRLDAPHLRLSFGQPIGLHPRQKTRAEILCKAEKLVDVALAVVHMHAGFRRADERHRLAQVLQPAIAFLRLDWHARRVHMPLECPGPLELRAGSGKLDRSDKWGFCLKAA